MSQPHTRQRPMSNLIRATLTPASIANSVDPQTGAPKARRKPRRCGGFADDRADLNQEAANIPLGNGLSLTDRQILILLRLDRAGAHGRATGVWSERIEFYV